MKSFLAAVLVVISVSASAQTQSVNDQIIVTASALPEKLDETPAAVSVITRKEIDALGARDLSDVLRHAPGLTVIRSGSSGKATSLFTRGSNSNHTLVLWNGIEIINPYFGGYDWGQFSTSGVEQVEVVRGPYSALYGSEAVAGVVNVITAPARDEMRVELLGGGRGLRDGRASLTHRSGSLLASGNFDSTHDDGFAPNDFFLRNAADGLLRWTASSQTALGLLARYSSFRLGVPTNLNGDASALVPSPNRKQKGFESEVAIPIDQTFGHVSWNAIVAQTRRGDTFTDPDDPFGFTDSRTDVSTSRARLTTRTQTSIGTFVAGGEYERASVDDRSNFGVTLSGKRRTEESLFIEDRLSRAFRSWSAEASAGARYDRFETFGSEVSPRVAVALSTGVNKFRAAYGEAFRAPSISELYSPFGGNPDLQAERTRNAELGYDRAFAASRLSITAFRGDYRDLITNSGFTYANVGRARSTGVESSFERDFSERAYSLVSYTYAQTKQLQTGRALIRRPRHSGSIVVGTHQGAVDANVDLTFSGRRDDIQPVAPFGRIEASGHAMLDLNVQYRAVRFTPFLKIENAMDRRYEEVPGYPSPRRRASAGVRFTM